MKLTTGLAQGWDRQRFDAAFDAAVKLEPRCTQYRELKAYYLLPRWYGQAGEWEAFAKQSADQLKGDAGAERYYRIVESIIVKIGAVDFRDQAKTDHALLLQGLELALKAWPESVLLKHRANLVACTLSEKPLAARLFRELAALKADEWPPMYRVSEDDYKNSRAWALAP